MYKNITMAGLSYPTFYTMSANYAVNGSIKYNENFNYIILYTVLHTKLYIIM